MIEHLPPDVDLFIVELSHTTGEHFWRSNTSLDVMTTSAKKALEVVEGYCESKGWKEVKVHVVRRRGQGTLVIDRDL